MPKSRAKELFPPANRIAVDVNGDWCASHNVTKYLVSDKVLEALNEGLKTWRIEDTFLEGEDWVNLDAEPAPAEGDYFKGMFVGADALGCHPWSENTAMVDNVWESTLIDMIKSHTKEEGRDFFDQLTMEVEDLLHQEATPDDAERIEKLSDNYRAFGDC